MQARTRTWISGNNLLDRCRQRVLPIEGDNSTLNLDFSTGVLDPRLTFSRPSTATFVNSSGYVAWADANLILFSETLEIGTGKWTQVGTASVSIDPAVSTPNGNPGAAKVIGTTTGSHRIVSNAIQMNRQRHTLTMWVRGGTSLMTNIGVYDGTNWCPYTATVVSGTATLSTNPSQLLISGLTTTWTKIQIVLSPVTDNAFNILIYPDNNGTSKDVYLWGVQLNPGSTAQTYYPTTTATYHAPRFDYSPTNIGEPRGLLIEGQTANVCPQSQALTTGWLNANMITPTNPAIADPFGGTLATWKLVAASGNALHSWRHAVITLTAAAYTFSFWAKAAEYDRVIFSDPGSGIGACTFLLTGNGTATVVGGATNPQITPYPGGWYRCSVTMTTLATTYAFGIAGYPSGATLANFGASYTGNGTDGAYATGLQIELGSSASSYIPTGATAGGITRLADSCAMFGTNFSSWFNSVEGTFFFAFQTTYSGNTPAGSLLLALNSDGSKRIIYLPTASNLVASYDGTSIVFAVGTATGVLARVASSYNQSNRSIVLNGGTVGTGSVAAGYSSAISIGIGVGGAVNAHFKQVKFYPTRLSDTQLQALTAL